MDDDTDDLTPMDEPAVIVPANPIQPVDGAGADNSPEATDGQEVDLGSESAESNLLRLLSRCKVVIAERKQKKLDKILQLAKQKNKIENGDVQKILRVSPASANRYLDQLVRDGKLKRIGDVGHAVFYEVI